MPDTQWRKLLVGGLAELSAAFADHEPASGDSDFKPFSGRNPFIDPDPRKVDQLLAYVELLSRWNEAFNLTAVRDPHDMISRHLLDSLSVLPWVPDGPLLDAGSGAGLPGIPMAIFQPGITVTLLDSVGKKTRFQRQVSRELKLQNIHPLQDRLESHSPATGYRAIISRAFSSLAEFARLAQHLMQPETRLLAMKGRVTDDEVEALPGWIRVDAVQQLSVPGLQQHRHLVIMSTN